MFLFASAVFVSAFLLFQVQPVIARFILPWYGGTPAVWTTCMLFFQVALLIGYGYAHLLATHVPLKQQPGIHLGLLILSLLLLPIAPDISLVPENMDQPTFSIVLLLSLAVGFPFVMVSSSAPLLQHWFAGSFPGVSPYRLYALSNTGSLLALLSYPFLIEPALKLSTQALVWSAGYILFGLLAAGCAWIVYRASTRAAAAPRMTEADAPVAAMEYTWWDRTLWTLLAACGSVVLLASTNQLCQDVAVVPLLWVLPLSLYLVSFIICFERDRWYQRWIWMPFLLLMLGALVYLLHQDYADTEIPLLWQVAIYSGVIFACCMVCHGELVRRRSVASQLTTFYLYVALGGALGGVFVNLIAPLIFTGYWELHGSLVATVLLGGLCVWQDRETFDSRRLRYAFAGSWGLIMAVLVVFLGLHVREQRDLSIANVRGFFGVLHVYQGYVGTLRETRHLYHGRIDHGTQLQRGIMRLMATSYYGFDSGIGAAIRYHPARQAPAGKEQGLRIGLVGLGVGTISALADRLDTLRFYEINPQVEQIARSYFSYLAQSKAQNEVVIGDARISMQRELEQQGSQQYDVLVVDAFSGDAIPVHLITKEAMDLYWQHLKPDGVLVVHITNFHLDLSDLVRNLATYSGKRAMLIAESGRRFYERSSSWALITSNTQFATSAEITELQSEWDRAEPKDTIWTDDFSNLYQVIDWE